jgi:hypothetical protein
MDDIAENEAIKLKNKEDADKKETDKKIKTKGKITSQEGKRELSKSRKNVESHDKEETTFEKELNISAEIKAIYENPKPTRDPVFKKHTELTEIFS